MENLGFSLSELLIQFCDLKIKCVEKFEETFKSEDSRPTNISDFKIEQNFKSALKDTFSLASEGSEIKADKIIEDLNYLKDLLTHIFETFFVGRNNLNDEISTNLKQEQNLNLKMLEIAKLERVKSKNNQKQFFWTFLSIYLLVCAFFVLAEIGKRIWFQEFEDLRSEKRIL